MPLTWHAWGYLQGETRDAQNWFNVAGTGPTLTRHKVLTCPPSKHETLCQCWFNVVPPSTPLAQHRTSTGFICCWLTPEHAAFNTWCVHQVISIITDGFAPLINTAFHTSFSLINKPINITCTSHVPCAGIAKMRIHGLYQTVNN